MTRLTFGEVAPCRACNDDGKVRGSGMDDRQRRRAHKAGEPVPHMQPCPECNGTGIVTPAQADKRRSSHG